MEQAPRTITCRVRGCLFYYGLQGASYNQTAKMAERFGWRYEQHGHWRCPEHVRERIQQSRKVN